MSTGKIKKIVSDRGFGFITDSVGKELFFHQSGLSEARLNDLKEGQEVTFDVQQAEKGPRAVNVRLVVPA